MCIWILSSVKITINIKLQTSNMLYGSGCTSHLTSVVKSQRRHLEHKVYQCASKHTTKITSIIALWGSQQKVAFCWALNPKIKIIFYQRIEALTKISCTTAHWRPRTKYRPSAHWSPRPKKKNTTTHVWSITAHSRPRLKCLRNCALFKAVELVFTMFA